MPAQGGSFRAGSLGASACSGPHVQDHIRSYFFDCDCCVSRPGACVCHCILARTAAVCNSYFSLLGSLCPTLQLSNSRLQVQ